MAARRCSTHGIHFPPSLEFTNCPVCKLAGYENPATAFFSSMEPDDDWDTQAKSLILEIKTAQQEQGLIPAVEGNVTVRAGQLWVSAWDVFPKVQRRLEETDLFRIGQQVFEVLHYHDEGREYLVRAFSMTLSDDDLRRLTCPE